MWKRKIEGDRDVFALLSFSYSCHLQGQKKNKNDFDCERLGGEIWNEMQL